MIYVVCDSDAQARRVKNSLRVAANAIWSEAVDKMGNADQFNRLAEIRNQLLEMTQNLLVRIEEDDLLGLDEAERDEDEEVI